LLLYPFRYLWWLVSSIRRSIGRPPAFVVFVLEENLPALPDPPPPLWQRFVSRQRLSVKVLGERFDAIARDARIKGVVLHLRAAGMPMATLQDLRELVGRLRNAGKRVVAWAPSYGTGAYYLACACDEILLMPTGSVRALGFSSTSLFLADGLARLGLGADFVQVSPYKSAADPLTKSSMSDELREQISWLLESQHEELLTAIAESRLLDSAGAKKPSRRTRWIGSSARKGCRRIWPVAPEHLSVSGPGSARAARCEPLRRPFACASTSR